MENEITDFEIDQEDPCGPPKIFGFDTLKLPIKQDEWMDAYSRMFHACFAILGQFVENELGTEQWFEDSPLYRGYRVHFSGPEQPKAIDLWLWYRDELPVQQEAYRKDILECFSGKMEFEDDMIVNGIPIARMIKSSKVKEPKFPYSYIEDMQAEKLAELLSIRSSLWT